LKEQNSEEKKKYGTFEWSEKTINFITGCKNDCRYCYAKCMGIRYKRNTPENWRNEVVREKDLIKPIPKHKGTVMFPSSHDITPEHLTDGITVLGNILKSGNFVLVVSKPHLECIQRICDTFTDYKDKILFRFTIGSTDSNILKYWETNAPSYEERLECLKLAYRMGFQTSISSEPLLDRNVDDLIDQLSQYVTDTIWIGKPNKLLYRTRLNGYEDTETVERCNELLGWINDPEFIMGLYSRYKENPMIRWKDSIHIDILRLLL
jgi:DNA repair photolyase